jgi:hypothetical protein
VVAAEGRNYCRSVCRCAVASRDLDYCPTLDRHRVHFKCEALWAHALLGDDTSRAFLAFGLISAGIYAWLALALLIVCGGWVIWWTTEQLWGRYSNA